MTDTIGGIGVSNFVNLRPDMVENIVPGLTCEWYFNKQVVVYHVEVITHGLVKTWAEKVADVVRRWPADLPYLALHDLSTPGVSLQYAAIVDFDTTNIGVTREGKQIVSDLIHHHPNGFARVAMNFSMTLSGQVNRVLAHRQQVQSFISYKLFYSREKSLEWLAEGITS